MRAASIAAALLGGGFAAGVAAAPPPWAGELPVRQDSPHYVVHAQVSPAFAQQTADRAEGLLRDMLAVLPPALQAQAPAGLMQIVCYDAAPPAAVVALGLDSAPGIHHAGSGTVFLRRLPARAGDDPNLDILRHEACHQVLRQVVGLPSGAPGLLWVDEGLACYFEGLGPYGLGGNVRQGRLAVLTAAYRDQPLPAVQDVLGWDRAAIDGMGRTRAYAVLWSLCHFLLHGSEGAWRAPFFAYVENARDWGHTRRKRLLFDQVFPDPAALQRDWAKHVQLLQRGGPDDLAAQMAPVAMSMADVSAPAPRAERVFARQPAAAVGIAQASPARREAIAAILRTHIGGRGPPDWSAATAALRAEEDAAPTLRSLADRAAAPYRQLAVRALVALQAREALPDLVRLALEDVDPAMRLSAARAIGELNHGIAPPLFYDRLESRKLAEALAAIEALAHVGDPYAVDALAARLRALADPAASAQSTPGAGGDAGVGTQWSSSRGAVSFGPAARGAAAAKGPVGPARDQTLQRIAAALDLLVADGRTRDVDDWIAWARMR